MAGTLKIQDMNLRDMIMRHYIAMVENAGHENEGNAIVWNTECCICLSIAKQYFMSMLKKSTDFAADCLSRKKSNVEQTSKAIRL